MRIEALSLERYGVFESRTIDLSGPGLIVVYGPNEAGKSTALGAIGDFLFGIPPTSPMGMFGYDAMRIGATLRSADGRTLNLRRRKGRGQTLVDETGAAHDDQVLAGFLGATDRDRFRQLFGLDHEALKAGGERLLAADGEIGRLIVEAGGGLRHLMTQLDALDAEADGLFGARKRGDRGFYQALEAYGQAEADLKQTSLSRDTYEAARRQHVEAASRLSALRLEKRSLAETQSRMERLVRVAASVAEAVRVEALLIDYADLPALKPLFAARWEEAKRLAREAEAALEQTRSAHGALAERLAALKLDPRLQSAGTIVADLAERAILLTKQRQDRPNRLRELADAEGQLVALRDRLGLADVSALSATLPPVEAVAEVQRLALEAIERRPERAETARRRADLEDTVARLAQQAGDAEAAGHDDVWGPSASTLANLLAQDAALEIQAERLRREQGGLDADLAAIWKGDLASLRALPCPDLATIQAECGAFERLESESLKQVTLAVAAKAEIAAAGADIARLIQGGEPATENALQAARTHRDGTLGPIRNAYLSGRIDRSEAERAADVVALDVSLVTADGLADRRTTEAQRLASLAEAERRVTEAEAALSAAEAQRGLIDEARAGRAQAWSEAFPQLAALHPAPAAQQVFISARAALLARSATHEQLAADRDAKAAELRPVLAQLAELEARAGLRPAGDAPLPLRVQAATAALTRHDRDLSELARRRQALEAARSDLAAYGRRVAEDHAAERAWSAAWAQAAARLGASADLRPEAGAALANQWAEARGVLVSLAQTRRRIERMDEDEAALKIDVRALAAELGAEIPEDALLGAVALRDLWANGEEVRVRRDGLAPEFEILRLQLEERERLVWAAQAALADFAVEAGLGAPDVAAMDQMAERWSAHAVLEEARRQALEQVRGAGDGVAFEVLRAELAKQDVDGLRGELASLAARLSEIDAEVEAAIKAEQVAALELAGFERGAQANRAMAERESAVARMHAALERYVELRLAHSLVSAAVAKVRSEQQDPLIHRAAELFTAMTLGEFTGIETDVDDKGQPVVVARRTDGGVVSVAGLSGGTRDQLFLAFRLASLESYCRSTEPLPFIVDDILVDYDDERSAATLDLLAAFSATTQVLLFTHHRSVRDMAESLSGRGQATLIELQRLPRQSSANASETSPPPSPA